MSKERARRREERLAAEAAEAARRARRRPKAPKTPKHPHPGRRRRWGRLPIGARPWSQRLQIAAVVVFIQFVVWQFVRDPAGRVAVVALTLLLLPAAVVLVFDRRKAP